MDFIHNANLDGVRMQIHSSIQFHRTPPGLRLDSLSRSLSKIPFDMLTEVPSKDYQEGVQYHEHTLSESPTLQRGEPRNKVLG